jgi:hypothetical protein
MDIVDMGRSNYNSREFIHIYYRFYSYFVHKVNLYLDKHYDVCTVGQPVSIDTRYYYN